MKKKNKAIVVLVKITPEVNHQLEELMKEEECTKSFIVRKAIKKYLGNK